MTDYSRIYSDGEELAANNIGKQKYQIVKIAIGESCIEISTDNPIPTAVAASNMLDYMLEISKGSIIAGSSVNKFGRSDNVDNGVVTDIWDRANTVDLQHIWVAPTQARMHDIASSSSDDTFPSGNGARTLQVYGLSDWNTPEVNQVIEMNGASNVPVGPFVIIHRMKVLTKGPTDSNVGKITATAQVDGTVTSQINVSKGQTQMVVYGIPSTQTLCLTKIAATINGTDKLATVTLFANPEPDAQLTNFLVKHTFGLQTTGSSYVPILFRPYKSIPGPAIIKMQALATANDTDISAWFDGILSSNN